MAQQQSGPINGLNPLIYTGSLPNLVVMDRRPTPADFDPYVLGHWWIVPATDGSVSKEVWVLVSKRYNIAEWMRVDGSPSGLESLTGDIGGAVDPLNGNINILGGTGIQVVGSPSTNTLTINGTNTNGINSINKIYITALGAGTYTVPSNLVQAEVEVIGGGGGSSVGNFSYQVGGGIFGSGGGYAKKMYSRAQLGTSQSYFVGNGGARGYCHFPGDGSQSCVNPENGENTTFGTFSTLITGGAGQADLAGTGVAGGVGSGGDLNINGSSTMPSYETSAVETTVRGFIAGGSVYTPIKYQSTPGYGEDGIFPGGGGTLGIYPNVPVGTFYGGNGGNGLIIITEYLG